MRASRARPIMDRAAASLYALASNAGVTMARGARRVVSRRVESPVGRDLKTIAAPFFVSTPIRTDVVDWISNRAAMAITESESRFEIDVVPPLLARIQAARDVPPHDSVEHRLAEPDACLLYTSPSPRD